MLVLRVPILSCFYHILRTSMVMSKYLTNVIWEVSLSFNRNC